MTFRILILVCFISSWAFACSTASATPSTREAAKQHFLAGNESFARGDYPRALAELEGSYRLSPVTEVLFNIAVTQKKLHRTIDAIATLRRFLEEGQVRSQGIAPKVRVEAERMIADLQSQLPAIIVSVSPPTASVFIDGRALAGAGPLVHLEPGAHELEVSAAGYQKHLQHLVLIAGKTLPLDVSLVRERDRDHDNDHERERESAAIAPTVVPAEPVPPGVIVSVSSARADAPVLRFMHTRRGHATLGLAGAAVASLLVGAALGGAALSVRDDYRRSCAERCDAAAYDRGHAMAVASDVMFGIAGATAVATAVVFLVRPRPQRVSLLPAIQRDGGMLTLGGSF